MKSNWIKFLVVLTWSRFRFGFPFLRCGPSNIYGMCFSLCFHCGGFFWNRFGNVPNGLWNRSDSEVFHYYRYSFAISPEHASSWELSILDCDLCFLKINHGIVFNWGLRSLRRTPRVNPHQRSTSASFAARFFRAITISIFPFSPPWWHLVLGSLSWHWFCFVSEKGKQKSANVYIRQLMSTFGFPSGQNLFSWQVSGTRPFGAQCLLLAFGQCGFGQKAQQDPGQDPGSGLISADWLVARSTVGLVCFATLRRRQSPRSRHTQTHLVSL